MSKQSDVPHLSQWAIIKEEFTGQWKMVGETYLYCMTPLMEVTRTQNINGTMHVVTAMEWGKSLRFHGTYSGQGPAIFEQNRFLLETLYRAQKQVQSLVPAPECRPTVNLCDETDKQLS